MNRKVISARLHGMNAVLPGFGTVGDILPTPGKESSMSLMLTDLGLLVSLKGGTEALIPMANVQIAVLAPEDKKAK